MGQKLVLSPGDSLLESEKIEVGGVSGGCYCCGQHIHVPFKSLDILPVAKIKDSHFYVVVCDSCERDIRFLKEMGIEGVSFDVLWLVQGQLSEELCNLEDKNGSFSELDRNRLLFTLYTDAMKEITAKNKKGLKK